MYLNKEFIANFLNQLSDMMKESFSISFDYFSSDVCERKTGIEDFDKLYDAFAQNNSPYINGYNDLKKELITKIKLKLKENFSLNQLAKEYLNSDDLPKLNHYSLATLVS